MIAAIGWPSRSRKVTARPESASGRTRRATVVGEEPPVWGDQ